MHIILELNTRNFGKGKNNFTMQRMFGEGKKKSKKKSWRRRKISLSRKSVAVLRGCVCKARNFTGGALGGP